MCVVYGDENRLTSQFVGSDAEFPEEALMYLQQRLVQLRVPLAFNRAEDSIDFLTRAAN